jgi:hypothetical protein
MRLKAEVKFDSNEMNITLVPANGFEQAKRGGCGGKNIQQGLKPCPFKALTCSEL